MSCRADLFDLGPAQPGKGSKSNISDANTGAPQHTSPPNRSAALAGERCLKPSGAMFNPLTSAKYIAGCKRWTCYPCGKRKAKELWHRCLGYRFERLVSLTAPAWTTPTRQSVKNINYAWKLWKQRLNRLYPKFDYLWANQAGGQHGQLHKHIAMPWFFFNYKAERQFIAERCAERGLTGVVLDFGKKKPLKHNRPVGYCLNYVTQDRSEFPKYARRVQTSVRRNLPEKQPGWCFIPNGWDTSKSTLAKFDETTAVYFDEALDLLNSYLALIEEEKQHAENVYAGQGAIK